MNCFRERLATACAVLLGTCCGDVLAADWPTHRHDLARSGVTEEKLPASLYLQWRHSASHAPRPAWPEPGRELNRLAFDYAYCVSVADGLVYFGSSADHKVYAVDLSTGRQRWSFFTEGPVRFAPAVEGGRVFAASDDGRLYCLNATDGKLIWRFRGGPADRRMIGNGRLISRWPLRTGVGVDGGLVYFAAGMWPSEGVYVYALKADSGRVVWKSDTSGTSYVKQPHPGSFSMTGVAPQGYVLGDKGRIFVPTGRNVPAAYNRETGKLVYYRSAPTSWGNRWGGTWNMLAGDLLLGWRCHVSPDVDVRLGEFPPNGNDGLVVFDAPTGAEKREVPGKLMAVVRAGRLYATGSGKVSAYDLSAWVSGRAPAIWETPHKRAYSLIMAAETLIVGGQGAVTAVDTTKGEVLWSRALSGQARSLAVADGRLLVGTTQGEILCYGPKKVVDPPTIKAKPDASRYEKGASKSPAAIAAQRILRETRKKAGFCLLLGAADGRLLYHLAKQSDLTIHCIEPDAAKVAAARRGLDAAGLYGVRVAIHHGTLEQITLPDYFADLIVVADGSSAVAKALPARELYRMLRPYGGRIHISATDGAVGRRLLAAGVPAEEISNSDRVVQVIRGKLPDADNWTHQYADAARRGASNDRRVRIPMKLLWFGEPGPARLITRHWGGPAPLCVNGRMFVIGQKSLIAVDAYNGRQLWRRDMPRVGWWPTKTKGSSTAADEKSVYLVQDNVCLRLDAATGRTMQTYRLPTTDTRLKWRYLAVGKSGVLGSMGQGGQGRHVFLLDPSGKPRWTYAAQGTVGNNALSMDDRRVYLIDRPASADVARAKKRGKPIAAAGRLVGIDAASGRIAWQSDKGIAGRSELWLSEGVLVATSGSGMTGYEAHSGRQLYVREARVRRFPVIAAGAIYAEPHAYDLRTGMPKQRIDPFTGEKTAWSFTRSYGCGAISGGANVLLFRSGTLGIYDLAGDSGVFNLGGVRAGCYVNAIAANGLVLAPPSDAACSCSYSFRTTVAMAPARGQRNWSIFYDRLPKASVRRMALNLGAVGDRRDGEGKMWLAMPRPLTRSHRRDIAVPFRFVMPEGMGAYRSNAADLRIAATARPWLYASGLKGLTSAEFDLEILDRGVCSWPTTHKPVTDGRHVEPCWDGYKAVHLAKSGASVTLRHDQEDLYVAYRRPAPAAGSTGKWKTATQGADAPVWRDDSFELYLSPASQGASGTAKTCLHVGLSASGARYDALWKYVTPALPVRDIPRLEITVDGKIKDWGERGLKVLSLTGGRSSKERGKMCPPADFDPSFRIGWNDRGLLMLVRVRDDVANESPTATQLSRGDSVEVFIASKVGLAEHYQVVVAPGADPKQPKTRVQLFDRRNAPGRAKLTAQSAAVKTPDGYVVEMLLPWKNLKIAPAVGREFAMQVLVNDSDGPKAKTPRFQVSWHPQGRPTENRFAYQGFRLAAKPGAPIEFKRGPKPDRYGLLAPARPYPYWLTPPPLGAHGEDPKYTGDWAGAVRAAPEAFTAEIAIPWKTLAAAGLGRADMAVDVASRGPLRRPPHIGRGFERMIVIPDRMARPRRLSVRLHFAEIEGAKPGQRVFDVKLQGKVVLKDFDVVRAAGGGNRAVVKQFDGVVATGALRLALIPKAGQTDASSTPIISGIEIVPAADQPDR